MRTASVTDISAALADPTLRSDDPLELLALPAAGPISERDHELIRMRQRGCDACSARAAVQSLEDAR